MPFTSHIYSGRFVPNIHCPYVADGNLIHILLQMLSPTLLLPHKISIIIWWSFKHNLHEINEQGNASVLTRRLHIVVLVAHFAYS